MSTYRAPACAKGARDDGAEQTVDDIPERDVETGGCGEGL